MRLALILSFLLVPIFCFAQAQNLYYLKENGQFGKYVQSRDSADYIRIVKEPDSGSMLYNVFEFYKNGKAKLIGKSPTIDPPRFEGQRISFYKSGIKESTSNYKKGALFGDQYQFYPNGKIYQAKKYLDSASIYDSFNDNYLIIANYDSLGAVMVENGTGHYKGYNESFSEITEEGDVKNGKKDGLWQGSLKERKVHYAETYNEGMLIKGIATYDDGKDAAYSKSRGTPPAFKGGLSAFGQYLSENIHYPQYERANDIKGMVVLTFIVEKNGTLSNIKVIKSVSPRLDNEAVDILKKSPRWIPGTMFGRPVGVVYAIPINFTLNGN